MKRRKLFTSLLCTLAMAVSSLSFSLPVHADAMRVVTLGADLSDAQKSTMLKYFKVNPDEVKIIYVTNQDERNHLGSYVPLEQIGTRTVSCAYVRPTTSGGIKVRTANLNWVTGNMIAASLSTSGVSNCEVIAACPFEVSGTGALTGVQMAYEVATDTQLDTAKKEIATQEMVVTGHLADDVGQNEAVNVINQAKMEVIGNNIQEADEIYNTVVNIVNANNVEVSAEELDAIVALLEEIAAQHYDYQEMVDTLQMVESNVGGYEEGEEDWDEEEEDWDEEEEENVEELDKDSIMNDLDESVLGEEVITSSTLEPAESEAAPVSDEGWETFDGSDQDGFIISDDTESWDFDNLTPTDEPIGNEEPVDEGETVDEGEPAGDDTVSDQMQDEELYADDEWTLTTEEDETDITETDTSFLGAEAKENFDKALKFCQGEYEGNTAALAEALENDFAYTMVTLDTDAGKALTNLIMQKYLSILGNADPSYTKELDDVYDSAELNLMNRFLKKVFAVKNAKADTDAEKILKDVSTEDKETLYNETIAFFEKLYGEETLSAQPVDAEFTETPGAEAAGAESSEEAWTQEAAAQEPAVDTAAYTEPAVDASYNVEEGMPAEESWDSYTEENVGDDWADVDDSMLTMDMGEW